MADSIKRQLVPPQMQVRISSTATERLCHIQPPPEAGNRGAQLAVAADWAPFAGPAAKPPVSLQFARVMS